MSRAFEEAQERRQHEYVASELGVTVEDLDDHPYELDTNASNEGLIYNWRVQWVNTAPEGVTVHGPEGGQWSDIAANYDDEDGPED